MTKKLAALKGMRDILPYDIGKWRYAEEAARKLFANFGYAEIRTPILEETALFTRSIGEGTEIVQKQMFSFKDRGERDIALRPEGTAPVVRAYLENGLDMKMPICKLFYIGPMFRSERPQAGRSRQFYQIGVESIGFNSPQADVDVIAVMMKLFEACSLEDAELNINSLGCEKDKKHFEQILKEALAADVKRLCEDCKKRYDKNILRIFDCKNETCRAVLHAAPKVAEHLCPECRMHFEKVREGLTAVGIKYRVEPFLVRGLDYYTGTVFEVTHKNLGSQDAVAAGGRYDGLIQELGGEPTPACGFAVGLDRLMLAAADRIKPQETRIEVFLALLGEEADKLGIKLLKELRGKGVLCETCFGAKSLKSQMRLADRLKVKRVLIIGEDEIAKDIAVLRDMDTKEQKEIKLKDAADTHLW
ncbi:MAG: histidine--tRNA ligase [Candidatus Omnitrophica bacterium]|nr:histidine--tRNA ligase [Candidatus Omnitrophota bacterium]